MIKLLTRRMFWAIAISALAVGLGTYYLVKRGGSDTPTKPTSPIVRPRSARTDFGFAMVRKVAAQIKDPLSLDSIEETYRGAALRETQAIENEIRQSNLEPNALFEKYIDLAHWQLYDGQFVAGGKSLQQARTIAESDPEKFKDQFTTLYFLQGVAALRQGETENCVECQCEGSCILPLQATALHKKRRGSEQAMHHFLEYLEIVPDDYGVCWLLNIAAMTLGEHPGSVPEQFRLPLDQLSSQAPMVHFQEIAAQAGVNRLHQAGGAIMDDFDNDGWLDLIETSWDPLMHTIFYRNRGDGTFEDMTATSGLKSQRGGLFCVQADYNNDGNMDFFICRGAWWGSPQRPSLLQNDGQGHFTDVTEQAGMLAGIDSQVASWADYDNDGWIDLFVGGETVPSKLFHNLGNGTFEERAKVAGVSNDRGACKGANWGDYDHDGYPDLYVSNFNARNYLFHNNRDGTFTDVANVMSMIKPYIGFSCWFWDYDNDGNLDILANSYEYTLTSVAKSFMGERQYSDTTKLYRNTGKGFEDVSEQTGIDVTASPMGSNFADFDNDGFLDVYLSTGGPSYSMLVPNVMLKNVDGKKFVDVTIASGTGHLQKGHQVACGDWDRDGDTDLFVQLGGAVPGDQFRSVLFQNPGNENHSLSVRLVGVKTNRAAIGARIMVTTPGHAPRRIFRHVTSGSSFGANPLEQVIGLGNATQVDRLEIYWPTTNKTQLFQNIPAGLSLEITEGSGDFKTLHHKRIDVPAAPRK